MRKTVMVIFTGILIAASIGIVRKSHGVDWQYFDTGGDGTPMYYDPATVETLSYDVVSVWVKYKTAYKRKIGNYGHSVSLFKIDCHERKLTSEIIIDFDEEGSFLNSVSSSGEPWFSISPDSLYTRLYVTVCPVPFP